MTTRAPWLTHFGLTRTPFSKSLLPSELFSRPPHQEAVARILHCVNEAALAVITGEVGAGKTVAARAARASLDPSRYQVIYV
jgi:type II secretory pathway predicted ATPase ExeA